MRSVLGYAPFFCERVPEIRNRGDKMRKAADFLHKSRIFSPDDFTALSECAILTELEMIYVNKNDTKTAFAAYYKPKKIFRKCEGALWHNM